MKLRDGKLGPHKPGRPRNSNEDTRAPEPPSVRKRRQDRYKEEDFRESQNIAHAGKNSAHHKGYDARPDDAEPELEKAKVIKMKSEDLSLPDVISGSSGYPRHTLDDQSERLSIIEDQHSQ